MEIDTQHHAYADSYASFDVTEWMSDDNGREASTVTGSSDEETLELSAMPDAFARNLRDCADHRSS